MGYEDRVLEICDGSYQLLREWELSNACEGYAAGTNPVSHTQVITVYDTKQPVVKNAPDTLYESILPWKCTFSGDLPVVDVEDQCSNVTFEAYMSGGGYIEISGNIAEQNIRVLGVDMTLGDHTVTYIYKDACGNITILNYAVIIGDDVPPVIIAQAGSTLSLTQGHSGGETKVFVNSIDAGSHDANCSEITKCILLKEELENPIIIDGVHVTNEDGDLLYYPVQCDYDGVFINRAVDGKDTIETEIPYVVCKDFVKFCCENRGENNVALVVEDGSGNTAIGWSTISVEEKTSPQINCQDYVLECGDDYAVEVLGRPVFQGSYCTEESIAYEDDVQLNSCGEGVVLRIWSLDSVVLCTQRITIESGEEKFDPRSIRWPIHHDGEVYTGVQRECVLLDQDTVDRDIFRIQEEIIDVPMGAVFVCGGESITAPAWCENACSIIGTSYEDEEVSASEACLKIIRHWTIIDWCTYVPNTTDQDVDHIGGGDEFEVVNDEWLGEGSWLAYLTENDKCLECEKPAGDQAPLYFRYTNVDDDGYYTYDQVIKIVDDTAPTIEVANQVVIDIIDGARAKGDSYINCAAVTTVYATAQDTCGG